MRPEAEQMQSVRAAAGRWAKGDRLRTLAVLGLLRTLAVLGLLCLACGAWAQVPEDSAIDPAELPATPQGLPSLTAPATAIADPPSRVVRLSVLQGNVSAEPASVNTFTPAELNQVLTSGDRLYTDTSAAAELQAGQIALRLGGGTDLTVTAMTDQLAQFGIAGGSMRLHSYDIPTGSVLEVDSPEAAITVLQPGDLRVDEDAAAHTTMVTVLSGQVQIDGPGLGQQLNAGDRVRVHAGNPDTEQGAYVEPIAQSPGDALDAFAEGRDSAFSSGTQAASEYLNPDTTGSADLASYGSWNGDLDYGPVWFPTVAVGWRPYCDGRWRWVAPWGWTWVGNEPWGFAPFHYGRWALIDGRWGWIPGVRGLRPVYAPALVTFVGGRQFASSLGYAPGSGVAAWFPLGPREPYQPWYRGTTGYLNRVNASNLYNPNLAEARAFYRQRAVDVFNGDPGAATTRVYANRVAGTVAMSQASFAGGQPVAHNQLQLPASLLAQAPILAHPTVSPERWMVVSGPARAVPPGNEHRTFAGAAASHSTSAGSLGQAPARPAFVHTQPAPGARPSFDEQRQAMERTDPGRPLPSPAEAESLHRPAGGVGPREQNPRQGGAAPGRPAPARSAGESTRPAASASPTAPGAPRK